MSIMTLEILKRTNMNYLEVAIKKAIFVIIFILVILPISFIWRILFRRKTSFGKVRGQSSWKTTNNWSLNPDEPF